MKLVTIQKKDVFTDSMIIAEGIGNQHKSVVALIKKQRERLERFGALEFSDLKSTNSKRGRPTKICHLNEPQATLLITFLDNTDIVADFKTELVRQFYAMRQLLLQKQSQIWQDSKQYAKEIRKAETDAIKIFVQYAIEQGSSHAERYYSIYSSLADKAAGIPSGERDNSTVEQLTRLDLVEKIIKQCIVDGVEQGKPYKEIYRECRQYVEDFINVSLLAGLRKGA